MIAKEISNLLMIQESLAQLSDDIEINFNDDHTLEIKIVSELSDKVFPPELTSDLFERLINKAKEFMSNQMALAVEDSQSHDANAENTFKFKPISSWINIAGSFKAVFIFGFDTDLARYLMNRFIIGELSPAEQDEYLEDAIAEISNVIIGSVTEFISKEYGQANIGVPATVFGAGISCACSNAEIRSYKGLTDKGCFEISTIIARQYDRER